MEFDQRIIGSVTRLSVNHTMDFDLGLRFLIFPSVISKW